MKRETHQAHEYLRHEKKFPNMWCAGCGIGIVMGSLIRAVAELELDKDKVVVISGIGCTGRMPVYLDFNTMHTTHGRALAFATGLKLARPDMTVIVVMGDGDALAIGGNHFIHAARRNIDLTAIIVNNSIYGMTGGQVSPTTPTGMLATTMPYGNIEQSFPVADLARAAGASLVARGTVYHVAELDRLLTQAIQKKGFTVVEAVSYCHTSYGRLNKAGNAVDMMRAIKEKAVNVKTAAGMSPGELQGKIVHGLLHEADLPEYTELYEKIMAQAQAQAKVEEGQS
jgi:2-oxoglutarate ferredoxin oxidoreductase subunit beta